MITIRKANERGHANHGWLDTYHTFSFADYYDPLHQGFRSLRVINDDIVKGGYGFGMHPHRNMEIVTYVVSGALEHKDSLGSSGIIRPGEIQRITAGKGVMHSEYNPSKTEDVRLLQIWLLPEKLNLEPSYEQKSLPATVGERLTLIASRDGRDGSVTIHQDAELYAARLAPGAETSFQFRAKRHGWLQLIRGSILANDAALEGGDGLAISDEAVVKIKSLSDAEFLLFDLA